MNAEALNVQVLSQLECPVCFETCVPPIYMCCNGHCVCAKCQPQLEECGECRAPGKPALRCMKLESIAKLVKLPCANQKHGCKLTFNKDELAKHLPECVNGFECHVCKAWKGCARDLNEHVLSQHASNHLECLSNSSSKSFWTWIVTTRKFHDTPYFFMHKFDDAIFWFEEKYSSKTHISSKAMRIVSNQEEDAARYYYSVEFKPKDKQNETKIFYQARVQTENSTKGIMHFVLPSDITDSEDDGKICYSMTMTQKK